MPMFYNPEMPVRKHLNHLPHWQQDSVSVFITWRLADSVPGGLLENWRKERDEWIVRHPQPWEEETEADYHRRFSTRLEEWMDQGMGACVLRNPAKARIVADSLMHFHGERFLADSFVIMPNHVHVLVRLLPGQILEKTVQSWKKFSARRINNLAGTAGSLWHKRYWDRLVRSEEHLWKIRRYILHNPEKAKLREGEFLLYAPWHTQG